MKKIILLSATFLAILFAVYFNKNESPIASPNDYEMYLTGQFIEDQISAGEQEIDFWKNKLAGNPDNFVYQKKLAWLYANQFKQTGQPSWLHSADKLLETINENMPGQVGVLHSLTANAITQHEFRRAEQYISEAYDLGEKRFISSLIFTDVLLERGRTFDAKHLLADVASDSHFDYLIRDVKYQDAMGDLAKAIQQMEKALGRAMASGNSATINWALSNLADMYGHDGRVKKSYDTYLKALAYNPADLHSLKGIAWIAFANDKNTLEAKRILEHLKAIHPVPDYDLLLAEIATYEQDETTAELHQKLFMDQASQPGYGNMYKSYLCDLMSGTPNAVAIAKAEIEERPHPMSFDLLAWAYFQNGEAKKALEIIENQVLNKTGEPVALYHAGIILKEAGKYDLAEKILQEALDASFELGPVVTDEVERHLSQLGKKQLAVY